MLLKEKLQLLHEKLKNKEEALGVFLKYKALMKKISYKATSKFHYVAIEKPKATIRKLSNRILYEVKNREGRLFGERE